jgi:hypothetical protein
MGNYHTNNQVGGNMIKTENLSLRLRQELSAFHKEERGASGSVDNVMIIFVAAIILIALVTAFNGTIWTAVTGQIQDLMGRSIG